MTAEAIRDTVYFHAVEMVSDENKDLAPELHDALLDELVEIHALTDYMCALIDAPTEEEVWNKFVARFGHPLDCCRQ